MGIVSKLENSTIELKCPICNSEETCNTSEYNCNYILIFQIDDLEVLYQNILILELHELVPQTCRSSQKCCFTKIKYGKGYKGDASVLKPTMMCAVPLIMDR